MKQYVDDLLYDLRYGAAMALSALALSGCSSYFSIKGEITDNATKRTPTDYIMVELVNRARKVRYFTAMDRDGTYNLKARAGDGNLRIIQFTKDGNSYLVMEKAEKVNSDIKMNFELKFHQNNKTR